MVTPREEEVRRLQMLVTTGYANPQEVQRYNELTGNHGGNQVPSPEGLPAQNQNRPVTGGTDSRTFIPLNTEAFARGGQQFVPPPQEGIYPAMCDGIATPSSDALSDQLWWWFTSLDGKEPSFRGALVTGALTAVEARSGAWKVKDVLDALDVDYQVEPGRGVYIPNVRGIFCQVEWQYVDNSKSGRRELRIQNVYAASQKIQTAIG